MIRLFRLWACVLGVVTSVGGLVECPSATAQDVRLVNSPAGSLTMDSLVRMDQATLEALYRNAAPGSIPSGFLPGRAIPSPGTGGTVRRSKRIGTLWKGKVFPDDGTMINQLAFGVKAVRAQVYQGESWLDGQPSIVLDYANTSRLFGKVRDEMREVSPGLYLGLTYLRQCPGPKLAMFYVVQAPTCCGQTVP